MTSRHRSLALQVGKASIWLLLLGSCAGLAVIGLVGSLGYPAAVLGALGLIGSIAVIVKGPRKLRTGAIAGAVASVLIALIGFGSGEASSQAERAAAAKAEAEKKKAEEAKAKWEAAIGRLSQAAADAPAEAMAPVCDEVLGMGPIPNEHREKCGTAYLSQGRALLTSGQFEQAATLLRKASKHSTNPEIAAALAESDYGAGVAAAAASAKAADEKIGANDFRAAFSLATAAQEGVERALQAKPNDPKAKALASRIDRLVKRTSAVVEAEEVKERRKSYIKESCRQVAAKFGSSSDLSELQKEELWKTQYANKKFAWKMQVVEVSPGVFGGYTVQWKCQSSDSWIQDVVMQYPKKDRDLVMQLEKGHLYEVEGKLKTTSTLLGMTAEPI